MEQKAASLPAFPLLSVAPGSPGCHVGSLTAMKLTDWKDHKKETKKRQRCLRRPSGSSLLGPGDHEERQAISAVSIGIYMRTVNECSCHCFGIICYTAMVTETVSLVGSQFFVLGGLEHLYLASVGSSRAHFQMQSDPVVSGFRI